MWRQARAFDFSGLRVSAENASGCADRSKRASPRARPRSLVRISSEFSALSHTALRTPAVGIGFARLSIVRGPIGGTPQRREPRCPHQLGPPLCCSLENPRIRARAECVHGEAKGRGLVVCVPVRSTKTKRSGSILRCMGIRLP